MRFKNLDILKSVSMYFVIILHILGRGGVLSALENSSKKSLIIWLLYIFSYCCVNLFGISTGFLMVTKKIKVNKIVSMWIKVFVYCVLFVFIDFFINREFIVSSFVSSLFPVLSIKYWYFTCYFFLFFLIPYLNIFINSLKENEFRNFILIITLFFGIFSLMLNSDLFGIQIGYSVIWLIYLYFLGAYLNLYNSFTKYSKKSLILIFISSNFIIWLSKILINLLKLNNINIIEDSHLLLKNNSIFMIVSSISLFLLINKFNIGNKTLIFFKKIRSSIFYVLIIHNNPVFLKLVFDEYMTQLAKYNTYLIIFYVLLYALLIFMFSILVDSIINSLLDELNIRFKLNNKFNLDYMDGFFYEEK